MTAVLVIRYVRWRPWIMPAPEAGAHRRRHEHGLIGVGAPAPTAAALAASRSLVHRWINRVVCRGRIGHCWHLTPPGWYGSIPGRTYCCECPAATEDTPANRCRYCTGPDDSTRVSGPHGPGSAVFS